MEEITVNLHMHTSFSDGSGSHADLARAAMQTGVDALIVTDHNVWVQGKKGYYTENGKRVLLIVGEEVHDQARQPQKNHLLVIGANRELAEYAPNPQNLIDQVRAAGGLAFIAHPIDPEFRAVGEPDISWVDWSVQGYTGIELWNGFSELKFVAHSTLQAGIYAFLPHLLAHGPLPQTLQLWDSLLAGKRHVVAVGGSDAHALQKHLGPIRRTVFPYTYHYRAVNTHLLLPEPLSGDEDADTRAVLDALRQGHVFIGYDLPASTCGFRFTAQGKDASAQMGESLPVNEGVTLQIRLPHHADCQLLRDGQIIKQWHNREVCTLITTQPGVYRVEVYLNVWGRRRGWIFSNPIYLEE